MHRNRRRFLGSAAAGRGGRRARAGIAGLAQDKVVWKAADVHPLGYPTVEAIERLGPEDERGHNGASRCRCTR
jgi:hypothetical protein